MATCYRVRRPIKVGEDFRQPGELVPEALTWFRVDHLVHSGFIILDGCTDAELEEAVKKWCPEVGSRYGIDVEPKPKPAAESDKAKPIKAAAPLTSLKKAPAGKE